MSYKVYKDSHLLGEYESKAEARMIMEESAKDHVRRHMYADRYLVDVIVHDDKIEFKPVGEIIREIFEKQNQQEMIKFYFPELRIEQVWLPYVVKTFAFDTTEQLNMFLTYEKVDSNAIVSIDNKTLYYRVEDFSQDR